MLNIDYHLHTSYSPDSNQSLEGLVKTAVDKGLKEICITDHLDNPLLNCYDIPDYEACLKEIAFVKELYKDIIIKFGCELSISLDIKEQAEKIINSYDFDFVIGSSHECNKSFLMPNTDFFTGKTKKEAFESYFLEVLENVRNLKCYNVYGHLDYVYRYSNYEDNSLNYFDYKDIIDEILKTIIADNKGIEINTSGYKYGLNNLHPQIEILKTYKKLGGEIITVGSDSHFANNLNVGFLEAYNALKATGFEYITTFDKMKPTFVKIN